MELTPKVLFVIAFIMVSTYSCNAIIFPEDSNDYLNNYSNFNLIAETEASFQQWLDYNLDFAFRHLFYDDDVHQVSYNLRTYQYIEEHYLDSITGWNKGKNTYGIFETYGYTWQIPDGSWNTNPSGSGWKWYNSEWVQGQGVPEYVFRTTRAKLIEKEYHFYLQDIGAEDKPEGNIIDTIRTLLGNLWDGFTQLLRLLTFTNIPNMPIWIVGILNIFFIPMWIVLIIGITPYVSNLIKALASFIESFKPW